jgi:Flp pilus assembly protein TadB
MEAVADQAIERLLPTTCSPTADERATVQEEGSGGAATSTAAGRRWNQRAFVALAATAAGLAVVVSVGWIVVHVAMGVLLVVFCTWHAVLNRRALLRYLKGKDSRHALPAREAIAAFAMVGAVFALTLVLALFGS